MISGADTGSGAQLMETWVRMRLRTQWFWTRLPPLQLRLGTAHGRLVLTPLSAPLCINRLASLSGRDEVQTNHCKIPGSSYPCPFTMTTARAGTHIPQLRYSGTSDWLRETHEPRHPVMKLSLSSKYPDQYNNTAMAHQPRFAVPERWQRTVRTYANGQYFMISPRKACQSIRPGSPLLYKGNSITTIRTCHRRA